MHFNMKKIKIIIVLLFISGNIISQTYLHNDKYAVDFDTPAVDQDWYLDVIDAHGAWDLTRGRSEVTIAFISGSGVNWEHEDLGEHSDGFDNLNRIGNNEEWSSWDDPNDNDYDDDGNGYKDDWRGIFQYIDQGNIVYTNDTRPFNPAIHHGTWIAGIMSAKNISGTGINGISGGTDNGRGNALLISGHDNENHQWLYLDEAIIYAVENGAQIILIDAVVTYQSVHITQSLTDAINSAFSNDVFVIAPTGWSGNNIISFPSSYINTDTDRSVFAVGASTEPNSNGKEYRHANSNYFQGYQSHPSGATDSKIDLVAPGEHIYTTSNVEDEYINIKGTTPSASMVAATVGLMLSVNPDLSYEQIEEILHETAEKIGKDDYYNYVNGWNENTGYGRLNTHRAVCAALEKLDDMIVITSGTWDEPVYSLNTIKVQDNSTLIIESTVYMGPEAKFIIEPGSEVILDGGKLTNYPYCGYDGDMWLGVEVWGDVEESQYVCQGSQKQGKITIENGGIIENAEIGILVGARDGEGDYLDSKAGGIVRVPNSEDLESPGAEFINNKYGIYFWTYDNFQPDYQDDCGYVRDAWNSSYLYNCKFDVNTNYLGSIWDYAHIYFINVEGVKVQGCDFEYNKTITPKGHGINSLGAGYQVTAIDDAGVPYDKCTFKNFTKAINSSTAGTKAVTVKNCYFDNNSLGIVLNDVNFASILFNDFDLGKPYECEPGELMAIGIDMQYCTGFAIEENDFKKGSPSYRDDYIGIRITETQATDEVYNNDFDGLDYGNYAVGENWAVDYFHGLSYYCNENTGNYADFFVEPDGNPFKFSGIQSKQGNDYLVTGNKFSATGATWHFYNGGDFLVGYYFCDYCANENPVDTKEFQVTDKDKNFDNSCPSHYSGIGGGTERGLVLTPDQEEEAEIAYATNLIEYSNVIILYEDLTDGGSTEATITEIETAWPDETWELRAELLGKSPHLSMEVLKATADKTDVLPESVIFEIMAANPDELKKEELLEYLEDKENPLPEYMINVLRQVAEGSSYKTVLEKEMAYYNRQKTRAAHDIARSILNSGETDNNKFRNWMDNLGGKKADEQIIDSYLAHDNYSDAVTLANMLPTLYNYTENDLTEHDYFMDVLNLQILLKQESRTIFDLSDTEYNNLISIAENSKDIAGAKAKGILEFVFGDNYCNCLNNAEPDGTKSNGIINPDDFVKAYGVNINTEPNPAIDWVAFNYSLPYEKPKAVIKIVDVNGKQIETFNINGMEGQKIWDTRDVKPGVYFYTLSTGEFNNSGKIVISK